MKKQRFYPKQVMRKLAGRSTASLDSGEKTALSFFMRNGRKYDMAVGVLSDATASDMLAATSKAEADAVLANTTARIFLKTA